MKKQEWLLQCQIVALLRFQGFFVFSVPNGGSRNYLEAVNLKRSGALAGVSDLIIVLKNKVVFVELKTDKGKQQTTQKDFENKVKSLGHTYLIWRNINDCQDFINEYKNEKEKRS